MTESENIVATYFRSSTEKQDNQHQRDSINEYIKQSDISRDCIKHFVDIESGSDDEREQFNNLLDRIQNNEFAHVVVWEISRISRNGATLQEFFDICETSGVTIHITDGPVEKIKPDGTGRFVADIIGMVYQQERRQLVRRVKPGVQRAKDEGKWVGRVPSGFRRDDNGYLQPVIEPKEGEDSYFEIADALERLNNGESYRSVANTLSISRQGISKIHQDRERRRWYLAGVSNDDRVSEALTELDFKE